MSCLWIADGYRQAHSHELVLPTGGMSLCVDLDDEAVDAIVIHGARSRPLVLSTSTPLRLMGVQFKPGGGFPFVGCPAGTLHNA
ncbi:MAG TPA: DUF6597 domain-containing transcriptional factor, partial [Gammaproteobacteria bacterium]|nr:DUF6597 domain-containing transcriptional factor [Gammaproteobacteria bacterium]